MAVGSVLGSFAVARPSPLLLFRGQKSFKFRSLSSSSSSAEPSKKLVLYSKPGCCLCDGLKEKLHAAFLLPGPDSLKDVDLQIRDITSNPNWENAYQYEIPVLAKVLSDGTEVGMKIERVGHPKTYELHLIFIGEGLQVMSRCWCFIIILGVTKYGTEPSNIGVVQVALPRLSPRLGVELLHKKIAAALKQQ